MVVSLKKNSMAVSFYYTVQSFTQFLWNWLLKGGTLVSQNIANLRAETCISCHNNKPSSEVRKSCSACNKLGNKAIDKVRATIIKENKTPSDSRLLTCGICGCDLKVSVWIPNVILLKVEDVNAYPTQCWKKKRAENLDV